MHTNILFISHDCSLSGAPIMLLHLIKWLKQNTNIQPIILTLIDGPLLKEFKEVAPTFIFATKNTKKPIPDKNNFIEKLKYSLIKKKKVNQDFYEYLQKHPLQLIHGNTIVVGKIYSELRKHSKAPIVSHVHELPRIINQHPIAWQGVLKFSYHFIACSKICVQNIVDATIDSTKISLCYEAIDINTIYKKHINTNIPISSNKVFTVGFSAHLFYRKGVDIFFQLIKNIVLEKDIKDIHFTWIGVEERNEFYQFLKKDLAYFNLEAQVTLLPISDNPFPIYNTFDIFVLPSREDPFPLVCLENAALGKPVICFADAGGMPEFVEQGAGTVVEYLNIEAMAEAILAYKNNPEYCQYTGKQAAELVQQFDINHAGEIILETYSKLGVNLQRTV